MKSVKSFIYQDANDNAPAVQRYGYVWYSDSTMIPGITIIGKYILLFITVSDLMFVGFPA